MGGHSPVNIEPRDLERAQTTWHGFTRLMKWSVIGAVTALILMGLIFIDW